MSRSLFLISFLLWTLPAIAQANKVFSPVPECAHSLRKLTTPDFDSSVEVEVAAHDNVLYLFTTRDGTVGSLMRGIYPPPAIRSKMMDAYPEYRNFTDIPWDAFESEDQRTLIHWAASASAQRFFKDRTVHGLRLKDSVELVFERPTEFMGKRYPAGKVKVNPKEFLAEEIHFMSPENIKPEADPQKLGLELHFRTRLSAGDNWTQAKIFQKGLLGFEGHMHQHVVARIPDEIMEPDLAVLMAARMAEHHRRLNTYAEMTTILEGKGVSTKADDNGTHFGALTAEKSETVFAHFATGAKEPIGTQAKISWVGLRGNGSYSDLWTWGYEFRDLDPSYVNAKLVRMMDAAQRAMKEEEFGVSEDRIETWLEAMKKRKQNIFSRIFHVRPEFIRRNSTREHLKDINETGKIISALSYSRETLSFDDVPLYLRQHAKKMNRKISPESLEVLNRSKEHNYAMAMLLKDWSLEPLFFDKPEHIERIAQEQLVALEMLKTAQRPPEVLKRFLTRSGIFHSFEKSLGI